MFLADLRQCFSLRRLPVYAVFAAAGIILVVQRGGIPPLIVVWIITLAALEFQFNNILYHTPAELEALTLLPVRWEGIIGAKNLATITASILTGIGMAATILFFSPYAPGGAACLDAALFFWSVIFPLLIIGNLRSVQEARKDVGRTGNALIQAAGMAIFCALPYVVLTVLAGSRIGTFLLGAAAAYSWMRWSVPHTAGRAKHLLTTQ